MPARPLPHPNHGPCMINGIADPHIFIEYQQEGCRFEPAGTLEVREGPIRIPVPHLRCRCGNTNRLNTNPYQHWAYYEIQFWKHLALGKIEEAK